MTFKRRVSVVVIWVTVLSTFTRAQILEKNLRGVIVERVERNSEAERAGLQRGDILLAWFRSDAKGEINSPFDVSFIEMEQAPRGTITLDGLRRAKRQSWVMGQDRWRLVTLPVVPKALSQICKQGSDLERAHKFSDAAERYRAAAIEGKQILSSWLSAWLSFRAASLWAKDGRWKDTDEAYADAMQQAAELAPFIREEILRAHAFSYQQRGDWDNAEKYYRRSIEEDQQSSPNLNGAANRDDLGMLLWERGDLKKAEEYCRQALRLRTELAPGSLVRARSLTSVGTIVRYSRGSGLQVGDEYYRQALAIEEELAPGGLDFAATLSNLGIIAWQRGDLAIADEDLHRALDLQERLSADRLDVANTLNALGTVADLQADRRKAEKYYRRALRISEREAPGGWNVSQSVHDLGLVAQEQGDLKKAEKYTLQAIEIDRGLGPETLDIAGDLNDLAYIAHDRGDLAKAEAYERQALAIEEKLNLGGLYLAETLHALGDVLRERGDFASAREYYERALAIREDLVPGSEDHAATLAGLASVLQKTGQLTAARGFYEQSLTALENQTARLGGSEDTRSDFRARHSSNYKNYVDLLLAQNHPDLALQALERSRGRMLLEMMAAAHVDVSKGIDPSLMERQHRLQADIAAKSDRRIRILNGEHKDAQVAAIRQEIEDLVAQYRDVEDQIRATSPSYAALVQPQPLSATEIQQTLLDADTLLLEYSLGEERSHVWIVSQDSLASYDLPKRTEIEAAARLVYSLLTLPNRVIKGESESRRRVRLTRAETRYFTAANALSAMVLGPVAADLGSKRLLIVSDGALQYIPFAILPLPRTVVIGAGAGRTLTPLVVEHEIVNLPSASVLAVLRSEEMKRKPAPLSVAVLADPVFDKEDARVARRANGLGRGDQLERRASAGNQTPLWSSRAASRLVRSADDVGLHASRRSGTIQDLHLNRLWFTRLEAESILAIMGHGQAMKAVDFEASRATATSPELAKYRIVHFATHGLLDSQNPELSGLVFSMVDAKGRPQNGFLELQDIYNMKLPAEMVVLSACETGLGKEVDGEGLVGLTRGFMYAGASRVVASLWRVSDVATAELMEEFYKAMERDGLRPAAALRLAQIRMRKQKRWASPYYWAGFQIQGEWK